MACHFFQFIPATLVFLIFITGAYVFIRHKLKVVTVRTIRLRGTVGCVTCNLIRGAMLHGSGSRTLIQNDKAANLKNKWKWTLY
jgi:hypothetical protein